MANIPSPRRNDPCPCGSGLRYKACHGKLEPATVSTSGVGARDAVRNGVVAMNGGRLDEALAWFDGALAAAPADAAALHYKGYVLCTKGNFEAGLPLLEQGVALSPGNAEFINRIGMIHYVLADLPAAIGALERAIAIAPRLADAHSNLALALRDVGEPERALGEVRRALEIQPDLPPARINHAMVLLALGRFAEAWPDFAWRPDPRVNLRDPAVPNALPHASKLPSLTPDPSITLHGEQGLGDTLFLLRFAPLLAQRGARLRFWGDARLGPMLVRSGIVTEWHASDREPPALDPARLVWIGDLPHLLRAGDAFPPAISLVADETRRQRMASRLAGAGPSPTIAVTWRAGLERRGKTVLSKSIEPALLGEALRGVRATFVCVQRKLRAEEIEAWQTAQGTSLLDLSAASEDLEDMLALMSVVDDYVGVSNTNMHLRAAVALPARVLVPWPPEWRWTRDRPRSPWFPDFALYRASKAGGWGEALARLANDLR
jgi:Flp pilus assembly protein TadD